MKIKISNEEELVKVAQEAIHILANLRKFSDLWNIHHGSDLKERKMYWEVKADEFLKRLQVPEHRNLNELKIEINAKENTTKEG